MSSTYDCIAYIKSYNGSTRWERLHQNWRPIKTQRSRYLTYPAKDVNAVIENPTRPQIAASVITRNTAFTGVRVRGETAFHHFDPGNA